MGTERLHAAVSADGTEIVGHVTGDGPPLVLVHGSLEDGRTCWRGLLPFLTERFTCYLPSTRGRGLSGDASDLTPRRRIEDVVAFVESIGEPVFLFGESDGGALALGAAAMADVRAVAAYEATVFEVADEQLEARLDATIADVVRAVERDDLGVAAEIFSRMIANEEEVASLSTSGYLDEAGQYMPVFLGELEQSTASDAAGPTDPSRIADISAPTLLVYGSETELRDWFRRGVRYIGEYVDHVEVDVVRGAGHFGVLLHPQPIAERLTRFFAAVPATT